MNNTSTRSISFSFYFSLFWWCVLRTSDIPLFFVLVYRMFLFKLLLLIWWRCTTWLNTRTQAVCWARFTASIVVSIAVYLCVFVCVCFNSFLSPFFTSFIRVFARFRSLHNTSTVRPSRFHYFLFRLVCVCVCLVYIQSHQCTPVVMLVYATK